jgi:hypothetical protein
LSVGVGRFVFSHHLRLIDALYCCLTVAPAAFLLIVFDYVLHHARLVSVIPLVAAGVLAFSYPVFNVALGLALIGMIVGPALSNRKSENHLRP